MLRLDRHAARAPGRWALVASRAPQGMQYITGALADVVIVAVVAVVATAPKLH
jgi:hypothetical protein|eukprot:COSAG06_NODE_2450_length_6860_cov_8.295814_3_plen_53_part_00